MSLGTRVSSTVTGEEKPNELANFNIMNFVVDWFRQEWQHSSKSSCRAVIESMT
jgi:hypothetical protein